MTATALTVTFAGVAAVDTIDLRLDPGEVLGLIGPNGAGKTTVVNALTGFTKPTGGTVALGGRDITGWTPDRVTRAGLARTFQDVRLFPTLTVADNVRAAAVAGGLPRSEAAARTRRLLNRFDLAARADQRAGTLTYGAARWLGLARALATGPSHLLLDEPAAGLNEQESETLCTALASVVGEFGVGLLVIDHDLGLITKLCGRVQVLDHGRTIAEGPPEIIRSDPAVVTAYVGPERAG